MSHWTPPFFGLTSTPKTDLFVDQCVDISAVYPGMSYWDAYALPVPVRRYMIQRYNKRSEEEQAKTPQESSPRNSMATEQNIKKFENKLGSTPKNISSMMQPIRNK